MSTLVLTTKSDTAEALAALARLEKSTESLTAAAVALAKATEDSTKKSKENTKEENENAKAKDKVAQASRGAAKEYGVSAAVLNTAARATAGLTEEVKNLARQFVTGLGIAGMIKLMTGAVEISREFGREIAKVSTALSDTSQLQRYSEELRGMSREFGLSAANQAASLYEIISAGQDAESAMQTLTAANKLAVGGLTTVETAADGLTSVLNAYAGKVRNAAQVSDILFVGAAAGKTNIEQLSSTLGQVAPIASTVGVAFEDLVGAISTLTLSGVSTNVAVTQTRAALNALIKPSKEASDLAKELGLEFDTAALRAKGLAGFLEDVRDKTGGSERAIATLFGSVEAVAAVLALTGTQAEKFADVLEQTSNSAGATEAAYAKMANTADQAFKRATVAAQDALLSLGNDLNAVLVPAANLFAENIDLIVAALGTATKIAAAYIVTFTVIPALYNLATVAAWNFVAALTAQNVGFVASIQQMGLLRAAGGTLVAAFAGWQIGTTLREQFVEVRLFGIAMIEGLMVAWERMKFGATVAWEVIKFNAIAAFDVIRIAVAAMVDNFASAVEAIDFVGMYSGAIEGARNVADGIKPATNAITDLATAISTASAETDANIAKIRATTGEMVDFEIAAEQAKNAAAAMGGSTNAAGDAAGSAANGIEDASKALEDLGKDAKSVQPIMKSLESMLRSQSRAIGNDYADAALDYADAVDQIAEYEKELLKIGKLSAEQIELITKARAGALDVLQKTTAELDKAAQEDAAKKLAEDAADLNEILDRTANMGFKPLIREIELVGKAMQKALDRGEDVTKLREAMGGLKHELAVNMVGATQQMLGSIQSMTKEGSKAYKAMEVASHALNVVMAISAILNQGKGDPYSAFARMAAMAAAVAGLVGSLGGFGGGGGGGPSSAESRQELQGTGTVLGDMTAKSESMANAIQITADATSELVGINRGMLRALQTMQNGIGNVAAGLAQTGFEEISLSSGMFSGNFLGPITPILGSILNSIFGGDQDLLDQGLLINGGRFGQVSQNPNASTYQTIETDGGWFHSDDIDDHFQALSQSARNQIRLVLQSLGDAVREGARALGLNMDQVNAAIEAYRIAEIRISTMDMTGEETQAALEAAFSSIFDGLAGAVVPFIAQFQQVGEGLGETLVRVATGVQVTQEALARLGFALEVTDPEAFARISEGLIQAAGGLEAFISGMSSFMDNFAPEAHKLEILQNDLTRAFEQVGLTVPETRDGLWELMQSLDATTEEGQEQIAALLRLSDVADAYYTQLERNAEEAAEAVLDFTIRTAEFTQSLADAVFDQEASDFQKAMMNIRRGTAQYIADANAIARARGEEGAATRDLALIHRWAANEVKKAIAQLEGSIRGLINELGYGEMDRIAEQIAAMEAAQRDSAEVQVDGINAVGDAAENLFQQWEDGIRNLNDYLDSLMIGDLSPLSPEDQWAEIQRQLNEALSGAQSGNVEALNMLPQLADQYLRMLRDREASGMDYSGPAQALIDQLRELGVNPFSPPGTGSGTPGTVALVPSEELLALYARRDELAAQQEAAQRLALATELAAYLGELSRQTGETVFAAAARLGVDFAQFITDLGGTVAATTAEQVATLGDVANILSVELPELADALELSLGTLNDTQSLLNDAFELQLAELPTEFRTQLEPLLRDLEAASSQEEQNAALDAINNATLDLPEELRLLLAPYLNTVDPITPDLATELDYLSDVWTELTLANDFLEEIRNELILARGGVIPGPIGGEGAAPSAVVSSNGVISSGAASASYEGAVIYELQQVRAAISAANAERKMDDMQNTQAIVGAASGAGEKVKQSVDELKMAGNGSVSYYSGAR